MIYIFIAVIGYFVPPLGLLLSYLGDKYHW